MYRDNQGEQMKTFKTLHKKSQSTGKICQWRIWVDGSTIHEEWGQVGGKLQSTSDTIKEGKNIGRSNETSPEQQALLEAQSKWEKKMKGEYTDKLVDAKAGKSSKMVKGGILPMLAHKYSERGDRIVYPALVQPKLDGHRMTCPEGPDGAELWSRNRQQMKNLPHITKAVDALFAASEVERFPLDGEGYSHTHHDKFEELTHFLKRPEAIPGSEIVQYHIYDAVIMDKTFEERYAMLETLLKGLPEDHPLQLVETIEVNNEEEAMQAFDAFLAQGYEGAIIRNKKGMYVNKRSNDLLKIKEFDDGEFTIIGVVEGRGKLAGCAMFQCEGRHGSQFECKLKGPQENLKKYWEDPALAIGRELTVQYQGYFKSGKPRFAVGLRFCERL
jgi:DNA ligase-1